MTIMYNSKRKIEEVKSPLSSASKHRITGAELNITDTLGAMAPTSNEQQPRANSENNAMTTSNDLHYNANLGNTARATPNPINPLNRDLMALFNGDEFKQTLLGSIQTSICTTVQDAIVPITHKLQELEAVTQDSKRDVVILQTQVSQLNLDTDKHSANFWPT